jgi:hypothetical protein
MWSQAIFSDVQTIIKIWNWITFFIFLFAGHGNVHYGMKDTVGQAQAFRMMATVFQDSCTKDQYLEFKLG